nr:methylmalonyl-CoA mutase family protein [Granulosicoccus antarcticus]
MEEAATARQARVDNGDDVIVGVNQYRLENEVPIDVHRVDNAEVRRQQIERLKRVKRERDESVCAKALADLTQIAKSQSGNLLAAAVDAARSRATLGEISDALESEFGRHQAKTEVVSGIYEKQSETSPEFVHVRKRVEDFKSSHGRAPHLLVAKMGQDGHDRGAKVIASSFGDIGFKIGMSDLFLTPEEVAELCIKDGVDVVGVSSLAGGHQTLIPQLINLLADKGHADIKVVCGGVIPEQDYDALRDAGVAEIFGPGTSVIDAANAVLGQILGERRNR